ncbi:hypothetical protein C8J57DRAFT_1479377 [Mycena rebaudengoi]|nr:hypothetical protein C8J57DRAFT_1479377 [Mycena rebaudengoi]
MTSWAALGSLTRVKMVRDKGIGFIHFLSVGMATKAVNTIPTDPAWAGKHVNYGKDRCAYVLKAHQAAADQAEVAVAQSLMMQAAAVGRALVGVVGVVVNVVSALAAFSRGPPRFFPQRALGWTLVGAAVQFYRYKPELIKKRRERSGSMSLSAQYLVLRRLNREVDGIGATHYFVPKTSTLAAPALRYR